MRNLIITLLIFQPLVNKLTLKLGVSFDIYNELLSIIVFSIYVFQILKNLKVASVFLVFMSFVLYLVLTSIIRDIYPLSFLQIIIYSQWFFFFLYFHSLNTETKKDTIISLKKILDKVLIFIVVLSFFEVFFYAQFRAFLNVESFNRGIGGFYLVSFFGSGASLANFMSFYIFIWFYWHYGLNYYANRSAKIKLAFAFLFLTLSFSRKEVLFVFLFLLFYPFEYRSKLKKWLRKTTIFIGIFAGLLIYYLAFFSKANDVAFGEKYVRWTIAEKSKEILMDNLPWGSGAGTFGSRVSLMMKDVVYEKYNVGQQMLGYKVLNQTRGPIYDAFMFTFTTEIGVGIFIFLFFFFKLFEAKTIHKSIHIRYIKNFLIFYFLGLSFFQPILVSSFGYLCAIFFGLSINRISISKFRTTYAKT